MTQMHRIGSFLIKEGKKAFPPTLFYLIIFHLSVLILHLDAQGLNITSFQSGQATIAALVIGKVYLVIDDKAFANCFKGYPLIFGTLWKTLIYWILSTLATGLEEFIPVYMHSSGWREAGETLFKEISPNRFIANHLILLVSIFAFSALSELTNSIGHRKVWTLFFGKRFFSS